MQNMDFLKPKIEAQISAFIRLFKIWQSLVFLNDSLEMQTHS